MQFELFYSNGGHGGPYPDFTTAFERANALLNGSRTMTVVEIRPRNNLVQGGFSLGNKDSVYVKKGEIYLNSPNFENDPISKLATPSFEEMTGSD